MLLDPLHRIFYRKAFYRSTILECISENIYSIVPTIALPSFIINAITKKSGIYHIIFYVVFIILFLGAGENSIEAGVGSLNPTSPLYRVINISFQLLSFLLLGLLFYVAFCRSVLEKKVMRIFLFSLPEIIILVLIIFFQMSVVNSLYQSVSITSFAKLARGVLFCIVFSRIMLDKTTYKAILLGLSFMIFFEFCLSMMQFINQGPLGLPIEGIVWLASPSKGSLYFEQAQVFRIVGTFTQPNLLSSVCVFVLPYFFIAFFTKNTKYIKALVLFSIIEIFTITILALSRWALFTCIASLGVVMYAYKTHILRFVMQNYTVLCLFLFGCILLGLLFTGGIFADRFLSFSSMDSSYLNRVDLIVQSIYSIRNYPLGIGIGTSSLFLINYDVTDNHVSTFFAAPVHSFYLLMLQEIGIIGFFWFLFFIVILYQACFMRPNMWRLSGYKKSIFFASVGSVAIYLFFGLWEPRSLYERPSIIFWISLGLLINVYRTSLFTLRKSNK